MEGATFGTVLIDGFVGATWTVAREAKAATLRVAFVAQPPKRDRVAVEDEGERLLEFIAADAIARQVSIA